MEANHGDVLVSPVACRSNKKIKSKHKRDGKKVKLVKEGLKKTNSGEDLQKRKFLSVIIERYYLCDS